MTKASKRRIFYNKEFSLISMFFALKKRLFVHKIFIENVTKINHISIIGSSRYSHVIEA
jgi:hypothetical protein